MPKRSFEEQIRCLIDNAGETRYRIAVGCGIQHATLSRFMNRTAGLSMANLNRLAEYLGWTITTTRPTKSKG